MPTQLQPRERAEAIDARLRFVVTRAADATASSVYVLPSTGKQLDFDRQKNGWKLSRLLYRVGELALTDSLANVLATQPLLRDEFDRHAFARTLGIIGTPAAVPALEALRDQYPGSDLLRRTVAQSILQITNALPANHAKLPKPLDRTRALSAADLAQLLDTHTTDQRVNDWLYALYLRLHAERPELLPVLRAHLRTLPLRGNYFQPLRHIFKAAEQFRDDTTLATLFWRIWKTKEPESRVRIAYDWQQNERGRWRSVVKDKFAFHPKEDYNWRNPPSLSETAQRENTHWGFTPKTRRYLVRRTFRNLLALGENADLRYPDFAAELLLCLNNETVRAARAVAEWGFGC